VSNFLFISIIFSLLKPLFGLDNGGSQWCGSCVHAASRFWISDRATDELVHRLSGIQHLRRDFAAANGKRSIEQAGLDEHRRLVPVDVLVRDLVAFELRDVWHCTPPSVPGWFEAVE
jgi:hypothetical protein